MSGNTLNPMHIDVSMYVTFENKGIQIRVITNIKQYQLAETKQR